MGYSTAAHASFAHDTMLALMQAAHGDAGNLSNGWGDRSPEAGSTYWFAETGREQPDHAMTGTVYKVEHDGQRERSKRVGTFRIEPNGKVTRWPTSKASQRKLAEETAAAKYEAVFVKRDLDALMR